MIYDDDTSQTQRYSKHEKKHSQLLNLAHHLLFFFLASWWLHEDIYGIVGATSTLRVYHVCIVVVSTRSWSVAHKCLK